MSLGTILLILLVLVLLGVLPRLPHSRQWGYRPSGIVGVVLIVLLVLVLMGRIGPASWAVRMRATRMSRVHFMYVTVQTGSVGRAYRAQMGSRALNGS